MLSTETAFVLLPEITLVTVAVGICLIGAFLPARGLWSWMAAGAVIVAATALGRTSGQVAVECTLAWDGLGVYVRWLALVTGGLLVLSTARPSCGPATSGYVASLLVAIAGVMLVAGADNLVLLFVGLELVSMATYLLLYLPQRDAASQEATAKYFFLGILASAILLQGFSFLYGAGGSTELRAIREGLTRAAEPGGLGPLARIAGVLIFAGLGFKIAAVPFHFHVPDVYQGTTNPNAGLLSVVPWIAGFVVLVRIMVLTVPPSDLYTYTWRIALALAVLTMTVGNVLALWQDNPRRLLAYSSIAHAGYALVALSAALASGPEISGARFHRARHVENVPHGKNATVVDASILTRISHQPGMLHSSAAPQAQPSPAIPQAVAHQCGFTGIGAVLFYLGVYSVAAIGMFASLTWLGREDRQIDGLDELAGLGRTRPLAAAMIGVFMFSMAGIPPLAGFWGKLYVFGSALSIWSADPDSAGVGAWFLALVLIGLLNTAVAAAYYLRIVAVMYFRLPLATPKAQGGAGALSAAILCAALLVLVGLHPGPLFRWSDRAGRVVRSAAQTDNTQSVVRVLDHLPVPHQVAEWPDRVTAPESSPDCWTPRRNRSTCWTTGTPSSSATEPAWNGSGSRPRNCWAAAVRIIRAPRQPERRP